MDSTSTELGNSVESTPQSRRQATLGSVPHNIPRTKLKISKAERRLYFNDIDGQDREFDPTGGDWHDLLTAPMFTSSVLQYVNTFHGVGKAPL
jgi:hypothetical protein